MAKRSKPAVWEYTLGNSKLVTDAIHEDLEQLTKLDNEGKMNYPYAYGMLLERVAAVCLLKGVDFRLFISKDNGGISINCVL